MTAGEKLAEELGKVALNRNTHELWQDWVNMCGYAMQIAVSRDVRAAEQLASIKAKYKDEEIAAMDECFELYSRMVEDEPWQDLLGDAYMRLEMNNRNTGQFFTPYNVAKLCAMPLVETAKKRVLSDGYARVVDPACGGGALLVAMAHLLHNEGVNYQQSVMFAGQDLNATTAMMCYIQLTMLGCPAYIVIGDTMRDPMAGDDLFAPEGAMTTVMYHSKIWQERRLWRMVMGGGKRERNA